jgi:hypothetical protein
MIDERWADDGLTMDSTACRRMRTERRRHFMSTMIQRRPGLRLALVVVLALSVSGLALWTTVMAPAAHAATSTITTCTEQALDTAISNAASGDTITFGCSGDIPLSHTLYITRNLTLDGTGQHVTLDGSGAVRVVFVQGVHFTLNGLTVAHGMAPGSGRNAVGGGGLFNSGGTVTITNSAISGNLAPDFSGGGGLYNAYGTVSISNSAISGNSTDQIGGGGLYNYYGTVSISNSAISGNSANGSGGFGGGGGLYNYYGAVGISNSAISGNSVDESDGGGLYNSSGTVSISNSTISDNSTTGSADVLPGF